MPQRLFPFFICFSEFSQFGQAGIEKVYLINIHLVTPSSINQGISLANNTDAEFTAKRAEIQDEIDDVTQNAAALFPDNETDEVETDSDDKFVLFDTF